MNNHPNPPPSDTSSEEDNGDHEDHGLRLLRSLTDQRELELELIRGTVKVRAGEDSFDFSKKNLVKALQSFADDQLDPLDVVCIDFSSNAAICQEFSRKMENSQIKSRAVKITCGGITEPIAILSFFNEVKSIKMDVSTNLMFRSTLDVKELCELTQWKNAKEVDVSDFLIVTPAQFMNIENHQSVKLQVEDLKSQSAAYLVNLFHESETMTEVRVLFENSEPGIVIPMRFDPTGTVTCNMRAPNDRQPGKLQLKRF